MLLHHRPITMLAYLLAAASLIIGAVPTAAQTYQTMLIDSVGGADFYPVGIDGDQVVGHLLNGHASTEQAALWSSTTRSYSLLSPPWSSWSFANGVAGPRQVGMALPDGSSRFHALMWNGTAATTVDLNPPGYSASGAVAIDGTAIVGWAEPVAPAYAHAILWRGDASNILDLQPASGYLSTVALGISGDYVVGSGVDNRLYEEHPLLWQISTGTMVDLSNAALSGATANGVSGNEQVGVCGLEGVLWHGSSDSAVLLTPAGFYQSSAAATNGHEEVGWGGLGYDPNIDGPTIYHALTWFGAADQYVDLQTFLPAGFTNSWATSIDSQGDIVGYAFDGQGQEHGVLWRPLSVPEPGSIAAVVAWATVVAGLVIRRRSLA